MDAGVSRSGAARRAVADPSRLAAGGAVRSAVLDPRSRPRQRHGAVFRARGLLPRLANLPLADAVAAAALGEVEMHVLLVIAVRSGSQHGGEAGADALAQAFAKIPR